MPWTSSRMSKGKFFIEKNHKLWRINYDSLFMNDQWLIIKRVNTILNVSSAQNQVAMRKRSVQKIQTKMPLQFNAEKEQVSNAKIGHRPIQKCNVFLCWKLFSETLNSYFHFLMLAFWNLIKEHPWNEYHGPRESIFHFDCDGPNTIVHMEETHNYGPSGKKLFLINVLLLNVQIIHKN